MDRLEFGGAPDHRQEWQHPREAGEAVHEIVFLAEHDRRPDDSGAGEGGAHGLLALALAAAIVRLGRRIGADGREMDESMDAAILPAPGVVGAPPAIAG